MAVWYCNYGDGATTGYYAVAQWAVGHVYNAGDIVRQLATPTVGQERCFRTAAGGTSGGSEPAWTLTKGGSTTDNTVTWTEVTGNSTYSWSAPFARLQTATSSSWIAAGDTVYVASIHAETQSSAMSYVSQGTSAAPCKVLCVTASGSVPPVAADLRTSATVSTTGNSNLKLDGIVYYYGVTFNCGSGANSPILQVVYNGSTAFMRFDSCNLAIVATGSSATIQFGGNNSLTGERALLVNTPLTFGAAGQTINIGSCPVTWMNTASAIGGTVPTTLFTLSSGVGQPVNVLLDGVDLSAAGSGKTLVGQMSSAGKVALNNCRLGASVTVAATPSALPSGTTDLAISDSGATQYRQERYQYQGTLTTETTFVRAAGASDGTTPISWKVVTTANSSVVAPFACFQIAIWNNATGVSKTATIEIENGGTTLTNADVWMDVEYLGSASYPLASVVSSAPATILTTAANLPTSSVTWNGGLGSAVKQYLQSPAFTPNMVGYVRATVYVAKASQTLYVDPVITIA